MSESMLHFFAVEHSTRNPGVSGLITPQDSPNRNVSILMRELKRQGATRLGVELLLDHDLADHQRNDPPHRYWRAIYLGAKRAGIEAVSLQPTVLDRVLDHLNATVQTAKTFGRVQDKAGWKRFVNLIRKSFERFDERDRLAEAFKELDKGLDFSQEKLEQLSDALFYLRSLRMHREAKKTGVSHAAVGGFHAWDAQIAEPQSSTMSVIGANPLSHDYEFNVSLSRARKLAYGRMKPLLDKVVTAAQRKPKARMSEYLAS